jgi:F-type H+-transporting ATPase subunit delta
MTKSKSNENMDKKIAERYANALIKLDNEISKEDILSQITDIQTSINNSEDLQKVMSSPTISIEEKKNIIEKIFGSEVHKNILNFLKLLIDKNRFNIFNSVVRVYKNEINKQNGLLEINVTSAIELNDSEKAMIKVKLQKILNKDIELEWGVNNDIIGGLIFEVNDNIIDCSLKHKLQNISKEITI